MAQTKEDLTEQVRRVYQAKHLSEAEKERLIANLLQKLPQPETEEPGHFLAAYFVSFFLPPVGILIGAHYLFRYPEEGRRPGLLCIGLTIVSLLIGLYFLKKASLILLG